MSEELFSVWQFLKGGRHECVGRGLGAKAAVETAKAYTERPAAQIGVIERIIITDDGDHTVFEWRFGPGVTFPPRGSG